MLKYKDFQIFIFSFQFVIVILVKFVIFSETIFILINFFFFLTIIELSGFNWIDDFNNLLTNCHLKMLNRTILYMKIVYKIRVADFAPTLLESKLTKYALSVSFSLLLL